MHLPSGKQVRKLIAKLIFIGLDILVGWLWWRIAIQEFGFEWESFFEDIFMIVFTAYIISGVWIILEWIFNFAHKFDDHDGFGSGLASLVIAPFTYVKCTLGHVFHTFGYLWGMFFGGGMGSATQEDDAAQGAGRVSSGSSGVASSASRAKPLSSRMNEVARRVKQQNHQLYYDDFLHVYISELEVFTFMSTVKFEVTLSISANENFPKVDHSYNIKKSQETLSARIDSAVDAAMVDGDNFELKIEWKTPRVDTF